MDPQLKSTYKLAIEERNKSIIEKFSALLPRKEQFLAMVKQICAAHEQNATNPEPTLNHQMDNVEMVEPNPQSIEVEMANDSTFFDPMQNQQIDDVKIDLLLRQDELTDWQQTKIVDVMHGRLPQEIRILRDSGHGSWICVEKTTEEEANRIHIYTPHMGFDNNGFKEQRLIDDLFQEENWKPCKSTVFPPCLKAKRLQDEFVFVLAYAMCRAMGQDVFTFQYSLGDEQCTQKVRETIIKTLNRASPLDGSFVAVWERPN